MHTGRWQGGVTGLKRRRGERLPQEERHTQAMRLPIGEVYGGVIASRRQQDDPSLIELAASIRRHGLLQPILVREAADAGRYALICGARRLSACRMAGLAYVDAVVIRADEAEAVACFMEEHLTHRTPGFLQEAQAICRAGAQQVAQCFALPGRLLGERLAMLALPEAVRELMDGLTLAQARPLLRVAGEERQREAAAIIAARDLTGGQARRLVMGPPEQQACLRAGRRRAVQEAMETVSRLVQRMRAQGVAASVTMHSQEGGVCVQILFKNDSKPASGGRKNPIKSE